MKGSIFRSGLRILLAISLSISACKDNSARYEAVYLQTLCEIAANQRIKTPECREPYPNVSKDVLGKLIAAEGTDDLLKIVQDYYDLVQQMANEHSGDLDMNQYASDLKNILEKLQKDIHSFSQ